MDKKTTQKLSNSKRARGASDPHPPSHRPNLPHPSPPVRSPSQSHPQTSSHNQAPTKPDLPTSSTQTALPRAPLHLHDILSSWLHPTTTPNHTTTSTDLPTSTTQTTPPRAPFQLPDVFSSWYQSATTNATSIMTRRLDSSRNPSSSLPIPAGENIATREYYHSMSADEPDTDIEYWSAPQSPKKVDVQPAEPAERVPSPTPSEILLQSELQDLPVLSAADKEMRGEGKTERERKVRLVRLREKLEERRERMWEREEERKRGGRGVSWLEAEES